MKSIRSKIGLSFSALVVIIVISNAVVLYSFSELRDSVSETLLGNMQSVVAAENMVKSLKVEATPAPILPGTDGDEEKIKA